MIQPLQVLCTLQPPPDLGASPFGPLVLHPCADLLAAEAQLQHQSFDALLLALPDDAAQARLSQWPALPRVALDCAVLVVAPEPAAADAVRWVQQGVQDVLPLREAQPERLAAAVRLAVERKRLEVAARKAYATDLATGLPNHTQLMEHMTHLLALREREPAAMAVLALRIEGLAGVATRLGGEAANVLRRKVAVRLRAGLRASDVVASIGSDTFAVLLAWIDDMADGARVAEKLARALQQPYTVAGQEVALAASVGVGQYPAHGKDARALLQRALADATRLPARSLPGNRSPRAANDEG